jgi:hypothetical protein
VGRVRQFFHGVSLPFHLAGALLADPVARKRYLGVGLLQVVAALVLALSCMGSSKEAREAAKQQRAEERTEDLEDQERIQKRIQAVEAAAQGDAGISLPEAIVALALESARVSARAEGDGRSFEEALADGGTAVAGGGSPPWRAPDATGRGPMVQVELAPPWWTVKGFSLADLAFWLALFAALQVSQWVVIALSREYHDAIARDLSLMTGVRPEDEEVQPRVRVDFAWMRKKLKRRWRAFFLFALGFPAMLLLTLPLVCNGTALSVLSTAWGAYWLVVFTAAKSGRAWETSEPPPSPWFLRAWTWLTTRVPGLRWGFLQRYGAFWARRTEEVLAPAATAERHPWAFAGLALVRFIGAFPPMKFFVRPLIPVASAHLLAEEAAVRAARVPAPKQPVIPAGETGA